MNIAAAVFRGGVCFQPLISLFCLGLLSPQLHAVDVYNLDFTAPDLGIYQVTAGSPSVQGVAGSFTDALVFHALPGGEQIRLPIGASGPRYEIQFDVLAHGFLNSDYSFGIYFDTATSRSLNLHGGLNSIYLYQSSPFLNYSLASLTNDSVYHFGIALDAGSSAWSVAINNNSLFSGSCDAAALQSIRFGIAPWIGGAANAPNTYVALDNVQVSVVPEPSVAAIALAGILLCVKPFRRTLQSGK